MDLLAESPVRLGLGTLRLTTGGRPDSLEAQNLILFALNQGIRVIDTADSYCLDEDEFHFGEHLVRQALAKWEGERSEVRVLTKVGFVRPNGKWVPCGRPEHLLQSVEQSLDALGVDSLFLLQLHSRDPRVPFDETLAAMSEIANSGMAQQLGLCNVSLAEVQQAAEFFPVAAVQNELSVLNTRSANLGVVRFCEDNAIPFFAHRPLGGHAQTERLETVSVLPPLAERHSASVQEVALAALLDISPVVVPLIGATRLSSVRSSVKAVSVPFDISDRMAVSLHCDFAPAIEASGVAAVASGQDVGPTDRPEVVVVMGIQGAGKSELVRSYVHKGYARLNRDEIGGSLDGLIPRMVQLFAEGITQVVLDNTYPTQASRLPVIQAAMAQGLPTRCVFLNTPMHEANTNIVLRMLAKYGMPLGPEEMKFFRKADPTLPPPQAMMKWVSSFERPSTIEGFSSVSEIPFKRRGNGSHVQKGLLLDVDGTLRKTISGEFYPRSADDVELLPNRTKTLNQWLAAGYQLFFVSNQSGIAAGRVSHEAVQAAMFRTSELLQVPITEVVYCSHPARPLGCFCRKPMPGLGVYLMQRHQLAVEHLVMVGDRDTDAEFAAGLGIRYYDEATFFSESGPAPDNTTSGENPAH